MIVYVDFLVSDWSSGSINFYIIYALCGLNKLLLLLLLRGFDIAFTYGLMPSEMLSGWSKISSTVSLLSSYIGTALISKLRLSLLWLGFLLIFRLIMEFLCSWGLSLLVKWVGFSLSFAFGSDRTIELFLFYSNCSIYSSFALFYGLYAILWFPSSLLDLSLPPEKSYNHVFFILFWVRLMREFKKSAILSLTI